MDDGYGIYGDHGTLLSIVLISYAAIIGFVLLITVAVYVLNGFALMKLFRKVGVEPWAGWVPIFNVWRLLELGGMQGWYSLFSLVPFARIVTTVFTAIANYRTGLAFRKSGGYVVLWIFLPFVWAFVLAAENEVYRPELITAAGYPPPLVGVGAVRFPYPPPPTAPQV